MSAMAVTLTVDELEDLVTRATAKALALAAPAADDEHEILTRAQVAELLQVTEHQVTLLVKTRGLPGHRLGALWRFRRREVLAWIAQQNGDK